MKSFYLQSDIDEIYDRLKQYRDLINNKSFLIVGSNGFLGKYFQLILSKFKHTNIVAVDKFAPEMRLLNVDYRQLDIVNDDLHKDLKNNKFDYIFAAASIASPKVYKKQPIETMDVGYIGLKKCLEKAKSDEAKLLFFSSSEVYGSASIVPTPETYVGSIPTDNERSCYDLSKLYGSAMVRYYVQQYNINASIVLPFNFYAPQKQDGRVMPNFMEKIVNNQPIEIYDGGNHKRCYTYGTDGITGCMLVLLLGQNGEKYNIGNPNDMVSVIELADKIEKSINKKIIAKIIPSPQDYAGIGNPTIRQPDITKAQNELNFHPQISLDEGIKRFYNWALENYKK